MEKQRITLPNDVEVTLYLQNGNLEKMASLANSKDFLQETEVMKARGNSPPFNLLIYDQLMALGLYMQDSRVCAAIRDYDPTGMIDWIDMALSLRQHPIRMVEKTSSKGEMFKRLEPRLSLSWIEYEPETQVLREIPGAKCPIDHFFETAQPKSVLYSLCSYQGKTEVLKMTIHDHILDDADNGDVSEKIKCEGSPIERYDAPIEEVEATLRQQNPNALVVREPLIYCSHGIESRPWCCLPVKFEIFYRDKIAEAVERSGLANPATDPLARRRKILGEDNPS